MQSIFVALVAVVAIGGGAWYFFGSGSNTAVPEKDAAMMKDSEKTGAMMEEKKMAGDTMMKLEGGAMEKDTMQKDAVMQKDEAMQKPAPASGEVMMSKGSYEAYAPEKVALAGKGDVVLFFRASWCPSCKALDANIRSNISAIPAGLTILDVNYDNSSELKKQYGVTYQHTFVQVDAEGNLIKKWSGSATLAALAAEVQ